MSPKDLHCDVPRDVDTSAPHVAVADFPTELKYLIFNYAAELSTQFCTSLSLVSSWTRQIALPHLLSVVVLKRHESLFLFQEYLSNSMYMPPTPNYIPAAHVSSLWIEAVSNYVASVFEACENATHISMIEGAFLWLVFASRGGGPYGARLSTSALECRPDLDLTVILNTPSPLSISWSESHNFDLNRNTTIFDKITRLRLANVNDYVRQLDIAHIARLTHFSVSFYRSETHSLRKLESVLSLPSLKFVAIVLYTDLLMPRDRTQVYSWVQDIRKTKSWVYILESTSTSVQAEWEAEMRGGMSIWEKAVKFTEGLEW